MTCSSPRWPYGYLADTRHHRQHVCSKDWFDIWARPSWQELGPLAPDAALHQRSGRRRCAPEETLAVRFPGDSLHILRTSYIHTRCTAHGHVLSALVTVEKHLLFGSERRSHPPDQQSLELHRRTDCTYSDEVPTKYIMCYDHVGPLELLDIVGGTITTVSARILYN